MRSKRKFALLILLAITALACLLLRTDYFNLTNTEEIPNEIIEETILPVPTVTDPTPPVEEPVLVLPTQPVEITTPALKQECFVGGCSSQVCSDQPDMMSTCEWRESYACYRTATCERQASGQCGWSETAELKSCLVNANSQPSLETI